ncbi:MAG: RDD family protein, partial [Fuerstiella sp.]
IPLSADTPVIIDLSGNTDLEAEYDDVVYGQGSTRLSGKKLTLPAPRVAAMLSPPSYFWSFINTISVLSIIGWSWTLSDKIVVLTMAKEKKIKRFSNDMFANIMTGLLRSFWPAVLLCTVSWIPSAMFFAGVPVLACGITSAIIMLVPFVFFLPIAAVHMAQPYSYRAWLINWMSKDLLKTLAPTLYVSAIFFVTVLLIPLGIAIGIAVGWDQFANFYINTIELKALGAISSYTVKESAGSFYFILLRMPFLLMISLLACTTVCMLVAIPAVFMMRVFGLFGLYFRPDLALCTEQVPLSPAGLGPRFLAYLVDYLILVLLGILASILSFLIIMLITYIYLSIDEYVPYGAYVIIIMVATYGPYGIMVALYFANWESGSGRATLGKWSIGLVVLQDDNSPMPRNLALKRFAMSVLSMIAFFVPFLICFFRTDQRAMQDLATKTKVVWRGDENL